MTPSGDGYLIDLAEGIIDLAGSFLEADRGSQCRAETQPAEPKDAGEPSGAADGACPVPLPALPTAATIAAMTDADKLVMRARLEAGRVAASDGAAPEVPGDFGEGLDPTVLVPGVEGLAPPPALIWGSPGLDLGGKTVAAVTGVWAVRQHRERCGPWVQTYVCPTWLPEQEPCDVRVAAAPECVEPEPPHHTGSGGGAISGGDGTRWPTNQCSS
jgi:hypothetical protein